MFLKATCHNGGHNWKDGHEVGQVDFVYKSTLPSPYAEGQHEVVGNPISCRSKECFEFSPVSIVEFFNLLPVAFSDWIKRRKRDRWN